MIYEQKDANGQIKELPLLLAHKATRFLMREPLDEEDVTLEDVNLPIPANG
jgi:hypothetical protein